MRSSCPAAALALLLFAACRPATRAADNRPAATTATSTAERVPPVASDIGDAALAAVAAAPWDTDPTGWGALCSPAAPCDTVVLDPRIVSLPAQAPAFYVPDSRETLTTLDTAHIASAAALGGGRATVLGPWPACSGKRDTPAWRRSRVACVVVGLAGYETASADAMTFALMVATPARGLSWPRVRVTRPGAGWKARVVSNASR